MWMIKEENSKAIEALEAIELVEGESTKVTKVGMSLDPSMKGEIGKFLKENLNIFVCSHKDMLGISYDIIQHCLNVNLERKPVQQRRRVFATGRNKAIMDEVHKLLVANFIREFYYPD